MEEIRDEVAEHRQPEYDIDPIFVNRWSPRSMTGETVDDDLMAIFEAARWAPSSYNNQPWRFVYATRDGDDWEGFLDLLSEGNTTWAKDAGVLVVVLSKTTFDYNGEYSRTHSFDTGSAWQNLALEGARRGLVVHAMQGFDYDAAEKLVDAPDGYEVEAMVAIGERAPAEELPDDLRENEYPNGRKGLDETVFEGRLED
ncbi:nitroreductase family protein [Halorutilales archaeon Cl-col2-1]